jgi:hypothetical protein
MRILFLTTVLPAERRTGGEVASQAFIDSLRAAGHEVTVVGYRRSGVSFELPDGDREVGQRPIETEGAGVHPALWMAAALRKRLPYSAAKYVSRRYRRTVGSAVEQGAPPCVVVDHAQIAWARPEGLPWVYIAHNVETEMYADDARTVSSRTRRWANRREARLMAALERRLVSGAEQVWALASGDAATLSKMGGDERVRIFELPSGREIDAEPEPTEFDVGLLGSWTWGLNAAALRWFLEQVLPGLPREMSIAVAGPGAEWAHGRFPNVTFLGRIEGPMRFLQRARAIAVPSVAGAGIQIKMLDAIASGRRIVASPTALWGIETPPETVAIAHSAQEFAAALIEAAGGPDDPDDLDRARAWSRTREQSFRDGIRAATAELGTG